MPSDPREALGVGSSKPRREAGGRKEGMGGDQEGSERPGGPYHFRERPAWPCVMVRNVGRGAG